MSFFGQITPPTPTSTTQSEILSRTSQIKVIWYRWNYSVADDESSFGVKFPETDRLAESTAYDISSHVIDFTFSKDLGNAAGSFSLTLANSIDWAKYMKAGEWMTVYMASDGSLPLPKGVSNTSPTANSQALAITSSVALGNVTSGLTSNLSAPPPLLKPSIDLKSITDKLRTVTLIQRIAIKSSVGGKGEPDINYVITGKDMGVCLEETDLWFNFLFQEQSKYDVAVKATSTLQSVRNLTSYLDLIFSLFFKPEQFFTDDQFLPNNLSDTLKQWLLPKKMLQDLDVSFTGDPYFGHIEDMREFHPTLFQNLMTNPIAGLQGTAWSKLKELSQPEFHEFFFEVDQGQPKVFFRPIPWAIDKSGYPTIGKFVPSYLSLSTGDGEQDSVQAAVASLNSTALGVLGPVTSDNIDPDTFRTEHDVNISNVEIFSFDIGPDFHNRCNHFLIYSNSESANQDPLVSGLNSSEKLAGKFPFKNIDSIRRHGLRTRHFGIASFFIVDEAASIFSQSPVSDNPQAAFLLEANQLVKDYWGKAEDFYTGSFSITGRNDISLGKVLVTDKTVDGASNMVFYIESYTDSYTTDASGVGIWSQSLGVTRGVEIEDLNSNSGFKTKRAMKKLGSFVGK